MEAAEMFEQLDDRDRILLATWTRPVRDLSEVIGLGHSQAGVLRQRLAAKIASELEGEEEGESVVLELQSLAAEWMRDRTTGHGSTLSRD
jgi:calcineurin-like phosphoesterase family protein